MLGSGCQITADFVIFHLGSLDVVERGEREEGNYCAPESQAGIQQPKQCKIGLY